MHRLEVGEHAAEPAEVDVRHPAPVGRVLDRFLRLLLGPDEEHDPAVGDGLPHEPIGAVDAIERLMQIDDVDTVALPEDETAHLRIPAPGLVTEMDSGLQELFHAHDGHGRASLGWIFRPREHRSVEDRRHHLGIAGVRMVD